MVASLTRTCPVDPPVSSRLVCARLGTYATVLAGFERAHSGRRRSASLAAVRSAAKRNWALLLCLRLSAANHGPPNGDNFSKLAQTAPLNCLGQRQSNELERAAYLWRVAKAFACLNKLTGAPLTWQTFALQAAATKATATVGPTFGSLKFI